MSRPPFQGVATPQRHSATPQPGDHYHSRSPSSDWVQDGRYPDLPPPSQSAPPRARHSRQPLPIADLWAASCRSQFPRLTGPGTTGTWGLRLWVEIQAVPGGRPTTLERSRHDRARCTTTANIQVIRGCLLLSLQRWQAATPMANRQIRQGGQAGSRTTDVVDSHQPTDSIYRPSTPSTERSASAEYNHPGAAYGGVRRGSAADIYAAGPIVSMEDRRRASDSSANGIPLGFDQDRTIGPEGTWLAVPRPGRRNDSDTVSVQEPCRRGGQKRRSGPYGGMAKKIRGHGAGRRSCQAVERAHEPE